MCQLKGLALVKEHRIPSFQGKTRMDAGVLFLQEMRYRKKKQVSTRSRTSDPGNYEAVAEKTKNSVFEFKDTMHYVQLQLTCIF
jgi:hypothetical protein